MVARLFSRRSTGNGSLPLPRLHLAVTAPGVVLVRGIQVGMMLGILGAWGLIGWWWESQRLEEQTEHYETATARIESLNVQFADELKRDGLTLTAEQIATVKGEVAFANQLSQKRTFSWAQLLSDLEDTVPPHISIQSVALTFLDSTVTLQGVARTLKDLNAFVEHMQTHRAFQKAVLKNHQMKQVTERKNSKLGEFYLVQVDGSPGRNVDFNMTVIYRPTL